MSRPMTRQQLLTWRNNWSRGDIALLEHALEILGESDYYEPNSKQYVGARVSGRVALYVAPGYIYWTAPKWADGIDAQMIPGGLSSSGGEKGCWYTLSTFQHRDASSPAFDELKSPCPDCFTIPSVSGACLCD